MAEYDAQIASTSKGEGLYAADLSPGWSVGGGLNGGYLLAVIGNAIRQEVPDKPDPISISAYYLGPGTPGPATVSTNVRRRGGSVATVAAELWQGDGEAAGPRITALASYGDLDTLGSDVRTTAEEFSLPPVEECAARRLVTPDPDQPSMSDRFELRFPPEQMGWLQGEPTGRGEFAGWFRLADGREPDVISLLSVVDLLPPVTFDLGMPGWAPTMELTVHVRAKPAPGWLKVRHSTRNVAGGMFEEDAEVWDSAGRLVAQSRQLARQPRPQ
ncbi:thioesterase family protein [Nocardioides insulae]|uniref:thioesterase family protein n=1 Tax=Nocardioides insulae TaxID=394734 RepID=UPI00041A3122|nr:thioesterase family protein [Nocardioides insulae]